jgi:hypothetical protein
MLQMAGTYMTVCDGYAYVSRTIEEALAQMLYLCRESNTVRANTLARGADPAEDTSSAYLTHLHESILAITL